MMPFTTLIDAPTLARVGRLGVVMLSVFMALQELGINTWFAGIRRDQAETRRRIRPLEWRDGRWKVHPIFDWNDRQIFDYLRKHDLSGVAVVNGGTYGSEPHLPFGGLRQSGNGWREAGTQALDVYSDLKTVYINHNPEKV